MQRKHSDKKNVILGDKKIHYKKSEENICQYFAKLTGNEGSIYVSTKF